MAMKKEDYSRVASAIAQTRLEYIGQAAINAIVEHLAITFRESDKRFARERFIRACRGENHCDVCKDAGY